MKSCKKTTEIASELIICGTKMHTGKQMRSL